MARKNAISMLKDDHDTVRGLLDRLKETTDRATKTRRDLLERIEHEIEVHMQLEEEIFYPAFREAMGDKQGEKMFHEAREEHRAATRVMIDLKKTDVGSPAFGGRAKVLAELVTHHADEEEEEMFSLAKKHMENEQLVELAEQMTERKRQLQNGKSRRRDVREAAGRLRV